MSYTLMSNRKVQTFYIKAVAELYQQIYGGIIVTNDLLNDELVYND